MTSRRTFIQTLKSIAGSFLVAPGLVLLSGDMDGVVTRWHQFLGTAPDPGLGVLSSVMLAASFSPRQLLEGLLQTLCPPLLLVLVGALLLWNASTDRGTALTPTSDRP
jgi:hypothetical protein